MVCSNELQEIKLLRAQLQRCKSASMYAKLTRAIKKLFAKHEAANNNQAALLMNSKSSDSDTLVDQLTMNGHRRPMVVAAKMRKSLKPSNHYSKITGKLKTAYK